MSALVLLFASLTRHYAKASRKAKAELLGTHTELVRINDEFKEWKESVGRPDKIPDSYEIYVDFSECSVAVFVKYNENDCYYRVKEYRYDGTDDDMQFAIRTAEELVEKLTEK